MFNLLVVCENRSQTEQLQSCIDTETMPLEMYVHTATPSRLHRHISSGGIDILVVEAAVMRNKKHLITPVWRADNELCIIVVGSISDIMLIQREESTTHSDRLIYLAQPVSRREMSKSICHCTSYIDDYRLRNDSKTCFELWKKNRGIVRERFWFDMISGKYNNYKLENLTEIAKDHDVLIRRPEKLFLPIIIRVVWKLPEAGEQLNAEARREGLFDLIKDTFTINDWSIPIITMRPTCFAVIWHINSEETLDRAKTAAETFKKLYREKFDREAEVQIGAPTTLPGLNKSNPFSQFNRENIMRAEEKRRQDSQDTVMEIKLYIERNINRNLSRQMISEHVFLNPDYMATMFKEKTGQCLSNYIAEQKMEHAKHLLIREGKSISEVAAELGYSNFSYFSRLFKHIVGLTPSEYKRRYVLATNRNLD